VTEAERAPELLSAVTGAGRFPTLLLLIVVLLGKVGLVDGGGLFACWAARLVRTIAAICECYVLNMQKRTVGLQY
jgi:hypothetical protein